MRRFSWLSPATQAPPREGNSRPGLEPEAVRRKGNDLAQRPASVISIGVAKNLAKQKSPRPASLIVKKERFSRPWGDEFRPESPPPLPSINFGDPFPAVFVSAEEFRKPFRQPETSETSEEDVPSKQLFTLAEILKQENSEHKSCIKSPLPDLKQAITIIITPPDDDGTLTLPVLPSLARQRSASEFSLPHLPFQKNLMDPTRLMPPADIQLDPRKLRQSHEVKEVRQWLISFINAKGDTFPRKLRIQMMAAYSIRELDLDPVTVASFKLEGRDEGVSIDQLDETDNSESLRILGQAFQSRIEEVAPMNRHVRSRTLSDAREESIQRTSRYLERSRSTPNLHAQPKLIKIKHDSVVSLPTIDQKISVKDKRDLGFKTALGAVRNIFSRSSSGVRSVKKSNLGMSISSENIGDAAPG